MAMFHLSHWPWGFLRTHFGVFHSPQPRLPAHSRITNSMKLVLMWQKAFRGTQGKKSKLQSRRRSCLFPFSCFLPNASRVQHFTSGRDWNAKPTFSVRSYTLFPSRPCAGNRPVLPGSPHCPGKMYSKPCVPQTGHKCSDSEIFTEDRTPRARPS